MDVGPNPTSDNEPRLVRLRVRTALLLGALFAASWAITLVAVVSPLSDSDDAQTASESAPDADSSDDESAEAGTATLGATVTTPPTVTELPTTTTTVVTTTTTTEPPPDRSLLEASGPIVVKGESDVVLENLWISNPDGDCLQIDGASNVTLKNSVVGPCSGRGVWIFDSVGVLVTDSYFEEAASGVYALDSQTVQVVSNRFYNTGHHFVQFDKVSGEGNQISYNRGENDLESSTAVDLINLFQSSGTPDSPIEVFENRLRNGGTNRSGSGIMTGDAGGQHQVIRGNVLVNPGQVGIGVAGGSNITIELNQVYSEQLGHTNVGIYVWDQYETNCSGHIVRDNLVNWTNRDGAVSGWWTEGNCGDVAGIETNDFEAAIGPEILE